MKRWMHYLGLLALVLGCTGGVSAATPEDEARMQRCPDGQYTGPREGAKRFHKDPYIWFASREFVKRFCMPESYIDDSLQGALALAVRIKQRDEVICGMYMGRTDPCDAPNELILEIFIDNQKIKLPKADPSVEFYIKRQWNSAEYLGTGLARVARRSKGVTTEAPGERRAFQPMDQVPRWTQFLYVGVHSNWAHYAGHFTEIYYRENFAPGVDFVALELFPPFGSLVDPDKPSSGRLATLFPDDITKSYAIAVVKEADLPNGASLENYRAFTYPNRYAHTITIPHKLAQLMYAFDKKADTAVFQNIQRAMQPRPSTPITE